MIQNGMFSGKSVSVGQLLTALYCVFANMSVRFLHPRANSTGEKGKTACGPLALI